LLIAPNRSRAGPHPYDSPEGFWYLLGGLSGRYVLGFGLETRNPRGLDPQSVDELKFTLAFDELIESFSPV